MTTLTPQVRTDLIGKVQKMLLGGKHKSEIIGPLGEHIKGLGVPDYGDQADEIIKVAKVPNAVAPEEAKQQETPAAPAAAVADVTAAPVDYYAEVVRRLREDSSEKSVRTAKTWLMLQGMLPDEAKVLIERALAEIQTAPVPVPDAVKTQAVPQPDANGEFACPADGAIWMLVTHGIPQTILCGVDWSSVEEKRRGKAPFLPAWQRSENTLKTVEEIRTAAAKYHGCNFGSVFNKDTFAFEADTPPDGVPTVRERFEKTEGTFTSPLMIASSEGRGHRYYKWVIGIENIAQSIEATKYGDFSIRVDGEQCVSPGSVHPRTRKQYKVISSGVIGVPSAQEIAFWNSERTEKKAPSAAPTRERRLLKHGQMHGAYVAEAGRLWNRGYEAEDVAEMTVRWTVANSEDSVDEDKVRKEALNVTTIYKRGEAPETAALVLNQTATSQTKAGPLETTGERLSHDTDDDTYSEASIPQFDPSLMKGIYKEIVDELTRGTTLAPQFIYAIAKAIVGTLMAGKVKFEDLDVEPLTYLALCGPTGSGKGEAWRRMLKLLTAKLIEGMLLSNPLSCNAGIKILNSADSGAGLKDAFFENPADQPIVCYIDEVASLGHKASEKKNPEIIDVMGELADSTSITRAKAKKSGRQSSAKTKDNAYLTVVMCGQNNEVFTSAFAGRTKVGWYDRLVPEYGVPQEPGNLPQIDDAVATRLLTKLSKLPYSGTMTVSSEASSCLDLFWATLEPEVRTVARLKKQLKLDAYLMAFGRGAKAAELSDIEDAIKTFKRQVAIRRVMFRGEVPNRVGFYLGLIKELTEWMRRRLAEGIPEAQVARSWRDYELKTNARRNNEEDVFGRAMETHAKHHLYKVPVKAKNGHTYERYLPLPEDE